MRSPLPPLVVAAALLEAAVLDDELLEDVPLDEKRFVVPRKVELVLDELLDELDELLEELVLPAVEATDVPPLVTEMVTIEPPPAAPTLPRLPRNCGTTIDA
jgi:hypothetical protein